ncbi:DNA cytosine methyltransferase [Bacteroides thetaiotaomicron]|nr:DNA cytosine methyltransferase [Bacteroides thetaiotaomicron]MDC2109151.1 DNA cytosine methyltransferase [Bacteroides thetaiotaomicron]
MEIHKFPYNWKLAEANFTKDKGKVFSCFACGGGSTMGYKLAGFDVIGCNEIDPKRKFFELLCANIDEIAKVVIRSKRDSVGLYNG